MKKAVEILRDSGIEFVVNDNEKDLEINESYKPYRPYNIFTRARYSEEKANKIRRMIKKIPGLKVNTTHAGTGDRFGLLVSHAEATKMHGIFEVQKLLKIKRSQTIGVGDSGNDFPLLMASGLKVAMGNAIPSLKDIADFVAPSVEDDGVADVIEKFILNVDKTV
jgi:hydroxymethylpyrimidine pyrophosphatase-like HAD family hydrolase